MGCLASVISNTLFCDSEALAEDSSVANHVRVDQSDRRAVAEDSSTSALRALAQNDKGGYWQWWLVDRLGLAGFSLSFACLVLRWVAWYAKAILR